jgi:acyl-coenzyme A thioesterase PaaI-like protein
LLFPAVRVVVDGPKIDVGVDTPVSLDRHGTEWKNQILNDGNDVSKDFERHRSTHILTRLGHTLHQVGSELHGRATVTPEMFVPGSEVVRTAVLFAWADMASGILIGLKVGPRVPVTLSLDVELYRPLHKCHEIRFAASMLKSGRAVNVASVEFTDQDGLPLATSTASFMSSPDTSLTLPSMAEHLALHGANPYRLERPLAEEANCVRLGPGLAELPRSEGGMNASNTINGALLALVAEEAVLSDAPSCSLASLAIRYLRPSRQGPVVASATRIGDLSRVEVCDAGDGNRMVVTATARLQQI